MIIIITPVTGHLICNEDLVASTSVRTRDAMREFVRTRRTSIHRRRRRRLTRRRVLTQRETGGPPGRFSLSPNVPPPLRFAGPVANAGEIIRPGHRFCPSVNETVLWRARWVRCRFRNWKNRGRRSRRTRANWRRCWSSGIFVRTPPGSIVQIGGGGGELLPKNSSFYTFILSLPSSSPPPPPVEISFYTDYNTPIQIMSNIYIFRIFPVIFVIFLFILFFSFVLILWR